ncbi:MAG: aminomethyltransferase beta-barrel domain-containing protein, partial [Dongiaceae bacterium]
PTGGYARVVERLRPGAIEPGDIVHVDGRVLGRHGGIINYTVGQRRGLGISDAMAAGEPLYVVRLDAAAQRVVVGPKAALATTEIAVRDVNWLSGEAVGPSGVPVQVKVRSTTPAVAATLSATRDGAAWVRLAEPQFGVAPGQACVFYNADRVLGGGWIAHDAAALAA